MLRAAKRCLAAEVVVHGDQRGPRPFLPRRPKRIRLRKLIFQPTSSPLKPLVVVGMGADPFPHEFVADEPADGTVVISYSRRPIGLPDGLEMQRRMKGVRRPKPIILASHCPHLGRQRMVEFPKFRRAATGNFHGRSRLPSNGLVWPDR